MTKVYLVRHGQTEWNRRLTFRGRANIPLNDTGRKQALAIAGALKDKNIEAVYASPLKRSLETAQSTANLLHIEIVPVKEFVDIDFGDWEGLTFAEVKKRYPKEFRQWEERPELVRFPNGETLDEARDRSFRVFRDIVRKNPERSILIVPHRVINKVLLCALMGLSNSHFWEIRQNMGCINVIEYSGDRFVMCHVNDICHLKEVASETPQPDF